MYGLPLPTPVMLQVPESRLWTDLVGRQVQAQFESVTADGNVALRAGNGLQKRPLVAFTKTDIEYIRQALKDDMEREVFPPGELQPLTAEQTTSGYRVWTDRKGVMFNAKFVNHLNLDRDWITREVQRRSDASRAAAAARRASAAPVRTGQGRMPGSPGYRPSRQPYTAPRYSPTVFEFNCSRCGHTWTRSNGMMTDICPKCSSSRSSGASPSTDLLSSDASKYSKYSDSSNDSTSSNGSDYPGYKGGRFRPRRIRGIIAIITLVVCGIGWAVRRIGF